jgi:hypothetical protein
MRIKRRTSWISESVVPAFACEFLSGECWRMSCDIYCDSLASTKARAQETKDRINRFAPVLKESNQRLEKDTHSTTRSRSGAKPSDFAAFSCREADTCAQREFAGRSNISLTLKIEIKNYSAELERATRLELATFSLGS